MNNRSIWMTILILVLAGIVKAQWHFIKLAVLGGMGLGGLWMVHKLAQDFNKIRNPKSSDLTKFIGKRSIVDEFDNSAHWQASADLNHDFESILRQDPDGCAQRTLCHIAATSPGNIGSSEENILNFIRDSRGVSSALTAFRLAIALGERAKNFPACDLEFPKCPHTREQIKAIFQF